MVQGDEYILKLSRYVHLNPVFTERLKHLALKERRKILRKYRWSSYRSYAGLVKELEFVDYGPVVAMMAGRRRAEKRREYRRFVEAGIARTDQEFADCLKASRLAIGSEAFCNWVRDRHFDLVMGQKRKEDASFRRTGHPLRAEEIETVVCRELRVDVKVLQEQRRDSFVRPVAARMLVKYGGLTQREVADRLGVTSGAAVSHQMKRLSGGLAADPELHRRVTRIESVLGQKKKQSASALER